ncbi:AAA family ATPase [Levilactobacillus brevis]|uniref:AAA family ATPase n=1 Tax=Levilactobacillus brevis TaxID=1580 RepID=UPI000B357871|nr:ATP-binding protein [Levilactobacillus brevis]
MLIDFTMTNFTSFKNETTLSAETGERLSRLKETNTFKENGKSLLKNLLIFGPNGAGKSNLLEGLNLMRRIVLKNTEKVTTKLPMQPFLMNDESEHSGVEFKVNFNYDKSTYTYEFSFNKEEIIYEKLTYLDGTTNRIYFERNYQQYKTIPASLRNLMATTKKNTLLLYNAQQNNDEKSIDVIQWFQNDLVFVEGAEISEDLIELMKIPVVKDEFLRFLHFADFNIIDINIRQVPVQRTPVLIKLAKFFGDDDMEVPETLPQLFTVHQKYNGDGDVIGQEELPLSNESKGTQKVFVIVLSIINAQREGNGKTLLFDEFDDSLHFELSKALVKIFNSKKNRNQFILTTHELQLLNSDVRVDQVYLVEKNFQGVSELKSIFDFKGSRDTARRDVNFMHRYIQGRFGAVPSVNTDEMLSALEEVNKNE